MTQPTASGPDPFDPATFTVVEPRTFEDLKVGDIFRAPSRTLTYAHATAFQAVSADNTYLLKTAQQSTSQATS
jgi:hypothetical protein